MKVEEFRKQRNFIKRNYHKNYWSKEQKGRFPSMLLGTLAASISGNALAGQGVIRTGNSTIRTGEKF